MKVFRVAKKKKKNIYYFEENNLSEEDSTGFSVNFGILFLSLKSTK